MFNCFPTVFPLVLVYLSIVSSRNDHFCLSSLSTSTVTTTGMDARDENKFKQRREQRTSDSQLGSTASELYGIELCNARETRSNSIGSSVARTQNQTQHCKASSSAIQAQNHRFNWRNKPNW